MGHRLESGNMPEKCEHCEADIKEHSLKWLTTKAGTPNRPVEDGTEWGVHRLWVFDKLSGTVCKKCWDEGKRFKKD
jgi:hypothetical protein